MQKTIQVADKPTLDYIFHKLSNYKSVGISVVDNDLELVPVYENTSVSTLQYNFYFGSAVVYNGEIHILGAGTGSTGNTTNHYKWDGSSWVSVSTLPYSFSFGSAVVYNGEIHILGSSNYTTNHYKWNGTSWVSVSTLPYSFVSGAAVVYNNEIHILGSNSPNGGNTNHYKWNGTSWSSVTTLPYFFYNGGAVVLNNEIHLFGSDTYNKYKQNYKWDGYSWVKLIDLPYNFNYGGTVVLDNIIHILGGSGFGNNHYTLNSVYKKASLYLLQNQKVYPNQDMSNVTALTNCTKETSKLKITNNGLTEFRVDTTDEKVVLTIKG